MSKNGKLFDSKTDPIPRLRPELDIIPIENNGESMIYFQDSMGYATDNFALDRRVGPLLSMLDGQRSIKDLQPRMGDGVTPDHLLDYIQFLDEHRLLLSAHFKHHANRVEQEYESANVHRSTTAGSSYPANPDELRAFLDKAFSTHETTQLETPAQKVKALYAPHIDPRVGMQSYVKAFSSIQDLKPQRVVILATSHYSGMHPDLYKNKPFIVSNKDFELPLATIESDKKAINRLLNHQADIGVTGSDRAHRNEHSIELHLLFLSYLWDHNFDIIPILVRSFDELFYMEEGHLATQVKNFGSFMDNQFGDDEDTLFLVSGDFAHVGKKFGDDQPARNMFSEVKSFDRMFMNYAERSDKQKLLQLMQKEIDPYRICGFAPIYTLLSSFPDLQGTRLSYDLWDESERESAVSFGSIVYSR